MFGPDGTVLPFSSSGRSFVATTAGTYQLVVQNGHGPFGLSNYRVDIDRQSNHPSVTFDDILFATEDSSSVTSDVLADDPDPDDDPTTLSYTILTQPSEGSVVSNANGTFTFSPSSGFQDLAVGETRTVSFTFQATDSHGADSNIGTVTVVVSGVNDAPRATNDAVATNEDTPLGVSAASLLANDTDIDGDTLTATVLNGPSHGTLVLDPSGGFTYSPDSNFHGTDSLTYSLEDGNGGVDTGTLIITVNPVNDAPTVVNPIADLLGEEDFAGALIGLSTVFNDVDQGDSLTLSVAGNSNPGLLSASVAGTSLVLDYHANQFGGTTLTIRATDQAGAFVDDVFNVFLTPVNDPPIAQDVTVVTSKDTQLLITLAASDVDGDSLLFAVTSQPAHGTLSGSGPNLIYTPNQDFIGVDNFVY